MKLEARKAPGTAWFLDYDGSVCPHLEVWEERVYDPIEILATVEGLRDVGAQVIWNTGRRPESLGGVHAGFLGFDGYFVHGSVHWHAEPKPGLAEILAPRVPAKLIALAEALSAKHKEYRLEVKPTSLRLNPFHGHTMHGLREAMVELLAATSGEWHWIVGPRGAELLAKDFDKSVALKREVKAGMVPVAVGDDLLDRPAIEAALRAGGYAVIVGEGCGWVTEIPHQAEQLVYCESPREVLDLIQRFSQK